ncbi:phosphoribosyl transferase domain protein [Corynascus similis CBS 632.67]
MATLESLKRALRQKATVEVGAKQLLSDAQYSAGYDAFTQGVGWITYQEFIIPQLSQLLTPLVNSHAHISVLEIGPGRTSILGYLPEHLRRKIKIYTAFEPNGLFATNLAEWLGSASGETEFPLPSLETAPNIHQVPFIVEDHGENRTNTGIGLGDDDKYDVVLFCHSMYGMNPKHKFIRRALEMLVEQPQDGLVVVFHRDGLYLDGLVCHRTASFPTGEIRVVDDDEALDSFSAFIAGFTTQDATVQAGWRDICRSMGRHEGALCQGKLVFSAPEIMAAFTRHATALPELTAEVPLANGDRSVKNREARFHRPALIVRPTELRHVQYCVQWALKHDVALTVIGGSHSGHCLWPNVVAVDMSYFDQLHVVVSEDECGEYSGTKILAGVGCATGDIVRKAMEAGLTVPLGARPSVGAGLWLQGGIGHLSRLYGLACDAIVGAVMVSMTTGEIVSVGCIPSQHRLAGAVPPGAEETDLLWAMKGAGTNFGIVVSVVLKAFPAPTYSVREWAVPLHDNLEARDKIAEFDKAVAGKLPRNLSADAYLYWTNEMLHLGITMFETLTTRTSSQECTPLAMTMSSMAGEQASFKAVDGAGVFETEMYMSGMHGGHGGGKTSSFKRCLFLKNIGETKVADILVAAVESRPTPFCYLHLLQGGGAVRDVPAEATAFGCRDWDFACVITGVWPRNQDGTASAIATVSWVYHVVGELLPASCGAYGADLGPDPRDAPLIAKAFGPNLPRLARLKHGLDPRNVLAYACPLPMQPMEPKLIILVTGQNGAGKDFCAGHWASVFTSHSLKARVVSISEATKREYAATAGADLNRLLHDRAYKEKHRPSLTAFFQSQIQHRPRLLEEHFLNVVYSAADVDVLFITGMRDEAPVATLSHLVADSRLLDVYVTASKKTLHARRAFYNQDIGVRIKDYKDNRLRETAQDGKPALDYSPSFVFDNEAIGHGPAREFAKRYLLPFFGQGLQQLTEMVRPVPDFPRLSIQFRHVLGISQHTSGLELCTSLLEGHFVGDWAKVGVVACCEAGGFIYAPPLAMRVNVPLALIREAGKLPPPTVSVAKSPSHISSSGLSAPSERIEIGRDAIPSGSSVVLVDDVLATGETLCAVLQLLGKVGIGAENVSVMVVAEFPAHRGRERLRRQGFGMVKIQSLLVYGGA